jgi:hypothetical protein
MISAATLSRHNASNLARAMPLISANQLREFGFLFCGKVAQERSRAFGESSGSRVEVEQTAWLNTAHMPLP